MEIKKKLRKVLNDMKQRCNNKNCVAYKNYGGRGIKVCKKWSSDFNSFYNWAISAGYKTGLSIDRINNDGNYCPENCRWATREQQNRNSRQNVYIIINGDKFLIRDFGKVVGVSYKLLKEHKDAGDIYKFLQNKDIIKKWRENKCKLNGKAII